MKNHLLMPLALAMLAACSSPSPSLPDSQLASLEIGEFKPIAGNEAWSNLNLSIKKSANAETIKTINASLKDFENGKNALDQIQLVYDRYTFELNYQNAAGKLIYQNCDKTLVHDIKVPVYQTAIAICRVSDQSPVGETPIQPTSSVTITPEAGDQASPKPSVPPVSGREIVAYYQSWSAGWASDGKQMSLAKLPSHITTVLLAFVRPEASYQAGQNSWVGTGMDFSSDFLVVKDAIKALKANHPNTKVLLSIGGATFVNWEAANPQSIAALVKDLGADGADLDYEPNSGVCAWGTGGNNCPGDQQFISIIKNFRAALPRPLMITTAAWSTGAYGAGPYAASQMSSNVVGANFGLYVNPLKAVGELFDAIYIMSYDAGSKDAPTSNATGYDPKQAFSAYRELYKGPLMLGVEVPPEAWGGHIATPAEAQAHAQFVIDHGGSGMMIWSLQKAGTPSANDFIQAMCRTLQLGTCSESVVN